MLYCYLTTTPMKKFHITKYIAVAATVEAASAEEAVKQFEANLDASTNYELAHSHGLTFGSSGEHSTVEEVHPGNANGIKFSRLTLAGFIDGGEFIPHYIFHRA